MCLADIDIAGEPRPRQGFAKRRILTRAGILDFGEGTTEIGSIMPTTHAISSIRAGRLKTGD
ncbi:hypothetical protein MicloDRAFT_00033380 [Microvirga lotononidis]|uniref:Uncharacterized protein n=1 Tax=Microvirga lotononidis TaxID=864069 RepID=I4YS46_9HYPH|nr:hypothetical protein MicloDRAFT_00033380 [Microvirga lotononidis]